MFHSRNLNYLLFASLIFIFTAAVVNAAPDNGLTIADPDQDIPVNSEFPVRLNLDPAYPTTHDTIIIEGNLRPSPPIQEVELVDYQWENPNKLVVNLLFIPGDFVPPQEDKDYFAIKLEPLAEGEYTVVFLNNGEIANQMEFKVEKRLPKFPIDLNILAAESTGSFDVVVSGEFPNPVYAINQNKVLVDQNRILASLIINEPTDPAAQVITPFKEKLTNIHLKDGVYDVALELNGHYRLDYTIEITDSKPAIIEPTPMPEPVPSMLHDVELIIDPFMVKKGGTIKPVVKGYFPSTAYEITNEEVRQDNNMFIIHWDVKEHEIGDSVIVPVKKEYTLENLEPGYYEVLFEINGNVIEMSKFHVDGKVFEPTKNLPFSAELRLIFSQTITEEGSKDTVQFHLTGDFPTDGHLFADKSIDINDDQITLNIEIVEPDGGVAEVITPYNEEIGSFDIADLWQRTYYATASVNGVTLDPVSFGGPINPWSWIDVQLNYDGNDDSITDFFITGNMPSPGYTIEPGEITVDGYQINVHLTIQEPQGEEPAVIMPFREKIGATRVPDIWGNAYQLNIFVNGELVNNRKVINNDETITPVLNWTLY
jgi:hypothetical protein